MNITKYDHHEGPGGGPEDHRVLPPDGAAAPDHPRPCKPPRQQPRRTLRPLKNSPQVSQLFLMISND